MKVEFVVERALKRWLQVKSAYAKKVYLKTRRKKSGKGGKSIASLLHGEGICTTK